jgi:hypothetical protein
MTGSYIGGNYTSIQFIPIFSTSPCSFLSLVFCSGECLMGVRNLKNVVDKVERAHCVITRLDVYQWVMRNNLVSSSNQIVILRLFPYSSNLVHLN